MNSLAILLPKVIRTAWQLVAPAELHGTFRIFWVVFSKNLDFLYRSIHFGDFVGLKGVNADAHARGFAPL